MLLSKALWSGMRILKLEAKDKLLKLLRRREVLPQKSDSLMGKRFIKLEKDQNWVYRLLDTAQPRYNYEQPSVPLVNVFNEDFCPFDLFWS